MEMIPDTVDLSSYMDTPEFSAKVRPASDFLARVKAKMLPEETRPRSPGMLVGTIRTDLEFRPGEVTAWVGYNGHRKSMFTSQLALDLCVQNARALIVSLEMDPADTMHRMTRQATGQKRPAERVTDTFHRWTDGKLWIFDHIGNLSVDHTLALCRYFADKHAQHGGQVFLDSMMMICESEERLDEQKRFSTGIVRLAQETGLHIHVITHCRKPGGVTGEDKLPTRYEIRGSSAISDQAHNVMVVWMNKSKYARLDKDPGDMEAHAEPCAVVKCDKQRGGKWEGKLALWHDERSLRFCSDRTSEVLPYRFLTEQDLEPVELA
jgi:twinkle protein